MKPQCLSKQAGHIQDNQANRIFLILILCPRQAEKIRREKPFPPYLSLLADVLQGIRIPAIVDNFKMAVVSGGPAVRP